MKLKDFLQGIRPETVINIGAENGNAFVWCAENSKFQLANRELDEDIKKNIQALFETNVKHITLDINARNGIKFDTPDEKRNEILDYLLKSTIRTITSKRKTLDGYRAYYDSYIPLMEREVVKSYPKINADEGIVIIIEGEEKGNYWDSSEFAQWLNKHKSALIDLSEIKSISVEELDELEAAENGDAV